MLGEYIGAGASTTKLLLHLEGSSTDSSGNGNNGTDTNITYSQANGKFGQGALFNGSNSKITIADNASLKPTTGFTVSAWINKTNKTTNGVVFNSGAENPNSPYYFSGFRLIVSNSGGLYGQIGANNTSITVGSTGGTQIDAGVWYHVVYTWSGTNHYLYINGTQIYASANTTAPSYQATNYVKIGCRALIGGSEDIFFGGSIDEVIVENVDWGAEKIKKYYTYSKGRFGIC